MTESVLMQRLADKVAHFFPVREGETLFEFTARGRLEHKGRRALLAGHLAIVSRSLYLERQVEKKAWIAAARLAYDPGPRQSCVICHKYKGLTEAHHVVPLGIQFDAGAKAPIQECAWLCPTHHAAEHVFIGHLLRNVMGHVEGLPPEESDALHSAGVRFVDLFTSLPNWHEVRWRRVKI